MPRCCSSGSRSVSLPVKRADEPRLAVVDVTRRADGQRHAATAAATSSSSASASVRQSSRSCPSRTIADHRRLALRSGAARSSSTAQAKLGSSASGSAPPPTRATVSSTVAAGELGEALRAGADRLGRLADHAEHAGRPAGRARDRGTARASPRGRPSVSLSARRARWSGMAPKPLDQLGAADDDPGLRAAEQLVAGEADEIGAGGERVGDGRLVVERQRARPSRGRRRAGARGGRRPRRARQSTAAR